jgi:hypothetical protein
MGHGSAVSANCTGDSWPAGRTKACPTRVPRPAYAGLSPLCAVRPRLAWRSGTAKLPPVLFKTSSSSRSGANYSPYRKSKNFFRYCGWFSCSSFWKSFKSLMFLRGLLCLSFGDSMIFRPWGVYAHATRGHTAARGPYPSPSPGLLYVPGVLSLCRGGCPTPLGFNCNSPRSPTFRGGAPTLSVQL